MSKLRPKARRRARRYALQALYQWILAGTELDTLKIQFFEDNDFSSTDSEYFQELLYNVPQQVTTLDDHFKPYLDRALSALGPIELVILRMGTYELANRVDVPYKVVINEAVELAKRFGPVASHKYINSILDKVAQSLRRCEIDHVHG